MSADRENANCCPRWISREDWDAELVLAGLELSRLYGVAPDPRRIRAYAHRRARATWICGAYADCDSQAIERQTNDEDPEAILIASETERLIGPPGSVAASKLLDLIAGHSYAELASEWHCSPSTAYARVARMQAVLQSGQIEMTL